MYAIAPTGSLTLPDLTGGSLANVTFGQLDISNYLIGKSRIVGGGFEVVNTTAPLYRQGLVTVYRAPQVNAETVVNVSFGTTPAVSVAFPARSLALPPSNAQQAFVLPGSKQWPAERGCYNVFTQTDIENPFQMPDSKVRLYA